MYFMVSTYIGNMFFTDNRFSTKTQRSIFKEFSINDQIPNNCQPFAKISWLFRYKVCKGKVSWHIINSYKPRIGGTMCSGFSVWRYTFPSKVIGWWEITPWSTLCRINQVFGDTLHIMCCAPRGSTRFVCIAFMLVCNNIEPQTMYAK